MNTAHKKHKISKKVIPEKKAVLEPEKQSVTSDAGQPQEVQPMQVVASAQVPVGSAPPVEPAPAVAPVVEPGVSSAPAVKPPASSDPLTDFKEKMNEEEYPVSDMPPKKNFMWPILFVFIIALAVLGGIFVYKQGMNKGTEVNVVTLSPTPTLAPEPTKAAIDLTKYTIKILNGSEVEGEAGKQKSNLEEEGFTVSSVGNAVKSDYTKTIIQAKKEVDSGFLDKLKSVLESSFVVGDSEELPEDADSDIIIIIGSKNN